MSKLINKYLSNMELDTLRILKNSISNNLINVTCMGLYNHGKSSLLNALIQDFENITFRTADIKETTKKQSFEYNGINYIDTPGLNADILEDKRVFDTVKESDINLFVHTVTTGEFVEKEIEFLQKIKTNWQDPKEFIQRTIFVISRVDKIDKPEDITNTINKMRFQINEIFDIEAHIIPISTKRYCQGMQEGKKVLIEKSNLKTLENSIYRLKDTYIESILNTRKLRLTTIYDDLVHKFESIRQEKLLELSKQKQARKQFLKNLHADIDKIESTIQQMYQRLGE